MPRQHRHEYAAGFPRGLLGDQAEPLSETTAASLAAIERCIPAQIHQVSSRFEDYGGSTTGSLALRLSVSACRTWAIWRCWPIPALSGLLPPDPASPGSGCPQLHQTAATARRRGPTPRTVQRRLMAHDDVLEVARVARAGSGPPDRLEPFAAIRHHSRRSSHSMRQRLAPRSRWRQRLTRRHGCCRRAARTASKSAGDGATGRSRSRLRRRSLRRPSSPQAGAEGG